MIEEQSPQEALRRRALGMLDRRVLSRRELIDKLVEKGEVKTEAEEAVDWLVEMGLLRDEHYAELIVRHYAGKGYGRKRIEQELWRRGIEKELWDTALQEMPEENDALDRFIESKLRGESPDPKEEKRVADALSRRGYSWDEIKEGLRRYKESL